MVHLPSTSAMTISPGLASLVRSTKTKSLGMMPASIMELPLTCKMKVASLLLIRYSSRLMVSRSSSSAGEGKPASTTPKTLVSPKIRLGIICPLAVFFNEPCLNQSVNQFKNRVLGLKSCELHDLLVARHAFGFLIEFKYSLVMFFHILSIVNDSSLVKKSFHGCIKKQISIY